MPAALFYAGPGQINAEVPRSLTPKVGVLVEVVREDKVIAATHVEARFAQPALFTLGQGIGQALVVNEDGSLNSEDRPAARGSIVTLFGTGDGETDPLFAGRAPGFVGLFQVNVQLPGVFTPPGVRTLTLSVGRVASQPGVTIAVK
jgi:hypothetical protein